MRHALFAAAETAIQRGLVLYDVTRTSYVEWKEVLGLLVMVLIGLLIVLREERRHRLGGIFLITAGLAFLAISTSVSALHHRRLVTRLRDADYDNVEGVITNFSPGSFDGHKPETFTVAGHTYTFSSAKSEAGYHDVQGAEGPLRDGVRVRIADVNGMIARFESLE